MVQMPGAIAPADPNAAAQVAVAPQPAVVPVDANGAAVAAAVAPVAMPAEATAIPAVVPAAPEVVAAAEDGAIGMPEPVAEEVPVEAVVEAADTGAAEAVAAAE